MARGGALLLRILAPLSGCVSDVCMDSRHPYSYPERALR